MRRRITLIAQGYGMMTGRRSHSNGETAILPFIVSARHSSDLGEVIMARRCAATVVAILLVTGSLPAAEIIRGKWQKVESLPAGSPIVIRTLQGEQIECTLFGSDSETLLIVEVTGIQRRIGKSMVQSIVASRYDDRLRNGAIIGLSAGLGFTALLATLPSYRHPNDRATVAIFGAVLFGLSGMGLGTLVDHEHQGRELVYEAPRTQNPNNR